MLACKLTSTHLKVKEWSETGIYDSTRYHVLFYTNNIDDVMVDHATIWSNYPQPASGLTLGQIGQMHKLPHKMLTILSHPNCLHFPGFPVSQVCSLYTDVPSIAAVGSCLSRTYRNFEQFQRKMDEVGCKTKIKKINFVPAVYKSENWEVGLILDTENHGDVRCYHDFQIKKADQRMQRNDHVTNYPYSQSCPGLPYQTIGMRKSPFKTICILAIYQE